MTYFDVMLIGMYFEIVNFFENVILELFQGGIWSKYYGMFGKFYSSRAIVFLKFLPFF